MIQMPPDSEGGGNELSIVLRARTFPPCVPTAFYVAHGEFEEGNKGKENMSSRLRLECVLEGA